MKQKVVIRVVSMSNPKSRTKAMKIAVGISGVVSAELGGDNMDQIVVIGERIDATCLIMLLRKKVGFAELVSVTPVDEKKKVKPDDWNQGAQPMVWCPCQYGSRQIFCTEIHDRHQDPCTIL